MALVLERSRIGGCIYNLADVLSRQGEPVDRRVRFFFDPLMPWAVDLMKRERLKPDQTAIAFIIQTVNTFHEKGYLHQLFIKADKLFPSLVRLYLGAWALMHDQPDYYVVATRYFDQRVLDSVDNMA